MIGKTLKHYHIEELIGKGGMGVVYRARDTKLNRQVALKVLKPELTENPDKLKRFLREARSAAAVSHPAITQIYDVDESDGTTFIAMEYVEGNTISRLIENRELDLLGSIEIALQVADGLAQAHKTNIVHRDIKSNNIMVTPNGHAKLLDFGLAKLISPEEPTDRTETLPGPDQTETAAQTMAGTVMGTIAYMSPEQARGQPIDQTSDVFSMGIVIYEMVTGELPFKGDSPLDTMHAIAFEEVRPVTIVRKNLPPDLHRIVAKCLRKRTNNRYPNAGALASDLKQLKRDIESGTQRTISAGDRLHRLTYWLKSSLPFGTTGLLFILAALALTALLIFTQINWGSIIGFALLGILAYRYIRNRKNRMLKRFTSKVSGYPYVRAIIIRNDLITVVVDKAQAKAYIRINSMLDSINQKLYFGKHLAVAVRDDLAPEAFQQMLRETGVAYVRDDVFIEKSAPDKQNDTI